VGEKLVRVVGFGALSESGGFVFGLNIGGDKGSGVRLGRWGFPGPAVKYILFIGDVTVEGGESGIVTGGYELFRGLTGFERSGLGKGNRDMTCGDDGGDGVDVVERNVGPGSEETGNASWSCRKGIAFSTACVDRRVDALLG
jgi:hypothetical protein